MRPLNVPRLPKSIFISWNEVEKVEDATMSQKLIKALTAVAPACCALGTE